MENVVYRYYKYVYKDIYVKVSQEQLDGKHNLMDAEMCLSTWADLFIREDWSIFKSKLRESYFELLNKELYEKAKLRIENLIEKEL